MPVQSLRSSIGKKAVMAISGLLFLGFVLGHLLGNLLIFMGPEGLNAYAKKLRSLGPGLWIIRAGLLGVVAAHIVSSVLLTIENRKARPIAYVRKKTLGTTLAARTMMLSGLLLLAFIVFHLMHFTFRITHPEISYLTDAQGHHDVYSMVVLSFQQLQISAVYLVAMFLLALHLSHGISSVPQTLGLNNDKLIPVYKGIGYVISALIFMGYSSIPVAILMGWVKTTGVAS
jgi:succinate dehydrogenase / fumarate reductase cytochrome b subunit